MIETRPYGAADAQDFLQLNRALLDYYRLAPATAEQETQLIKRLDAGRFLACELAFFDGVPAGFATWLLVFPAGTGVAMFMKELFVTPDFHGHGIGRALMAHLAQIALREGCKRIDWQTDSDNAGARAFYAKLQVSETNKVSYRWPVAAFADFGTGAHDGDQ